jgi:hypothetical protein
VRSREAVVGGERVGGRVGGSWEVHETLCGLSPAFVVLTSGSLRAGADHRLWDGKVQAGVASFYDTYVCFVNVDADVDV